MTAVTYVPPKDVQPCLTPILDNQVAPIDLCISYLFSTVFSVQSYVDYWKYNNVLYIPENQGLEIRDISALTANPRDEALSQLFETEEGDSDKTVLFKQSFTPYTTMMNTLMAISGKNMSIPTQHYKMQFDDSGEHITSMTSALCFDSFDDLMPLGSNCLIKSKELWQINACDHLLEIRLGDLIRTMVLCNRSHIEFPANRRVKYMGITEVEFIKVTECNVTTTINEMLAKRAVPGTEVTYRMGKKGMIRGFRSEDDEGQEFFGFEVAGGISFTIKETFRYRSISEFLGRIKDFGLIIPKNQLIQIPANEREVKQFNGSVANLSKHFKVEIRKDKILLIALNNVTLKGIL